MTHTVPNGSLRPALRFRTARFSTTNIGTPYSTEPFTEAPLPDPPAIILRARSSPRNNSSPQDVEGAEAKRTGPPASPWSGTRHGALRIRWTGIVPKGSSRRRPRQVRRVPPLAISTPSTYLVAALRDGGYRSALPVERRDKLNLSILNPMTLDTRRYSLAHRAARLAVEPCPAKAEPKSSLSSILASHIRLLHHTFQQDLKSTETVPNLENRLLSVYDEPTLQYLSHQGYSVQDVMAWAWIITSPTSAQVSQRLTIAASEPDWPSLPLFLYFFVLRRREISAQSLKLLINHAWHRILPPNAPARMALKADALYNRFPGTKVAKAHYPRLDSTTFMVMAVRLMRHARRKWSPGLLSIASMIATYFTDAAHTQPPREPSRDALDRAKTTFQFNRCLSLMALPSSVGPMVSITYHQRAQFRLLEAMADLQPPIPVNKEGYRAIVRVQVAHRKTIREREWANYKAKSWPPWKEEKLGIDAERGDEGKASRAKEALGRMQEAGYEHQQYEQVASIFAGWDTDQSPTIQTRTTVPRASVVSNNERETKQDVWAARIRATRTLKEAWACFLAYQDAKLPPHMDIYYAMSEKIVFSNISKSAGTPSLPGDGREVHPEPMSPRETTYVRTPPPDIDALFKQMLSEGIKPSGRFLAFLIGHANSVEKGTSYLWNSLLRQEQVIALVNSYQQRYNSDLQSIPDYLFAAFIRLLCRHSNTPGFILRNDNRRVRGVSTLSHALGLMKHRESQYLPPWNDILAALAAPGSYLHDPNQTTTVALAAWKSTLRALDQMKKVDIPVDFQGLYSICRGLERAIFSIHPAREDTWAMLSRKTEWIDTILHDGVGRVKAEFDRLVGTSVKPFDLSLDKTHPEAESQLDPTTMIPPMLLTPDTAHLHALIRVLGVAGDFNGLLSLLRWMDLYQPELHTLAEERANGARWGRLCLIAMRVFLEGSTLGPEARGDESTSPAGASQDVIQATYEIMEGMVHWGGWPNDEEVALYLRGSKSDT